MIREAISALRTNEVSMKDILAYIQTNYPAITGDSDKWKRSAKIIVRKMADKGLLQKRPATFTLS